MATATELIFDIVNMTVVDLHTTMTCSMISKECKEIVNRSEKFLDFQIAKKDGIVDAVEKNSLLQNVLNAFSIDVDMPFWRARLGKAIKNNYNDYAFAVFMNIDNISVDTKILQALFTFDGGAINPMTQGVIRSSSMLISQFSRASRFRVIYAVIAIIMSWLEHIPVETSEQPYINNSKLLMHFADKAKLLESSFEEFSTSNPELTHDVSFESIKMWVKQLMNRYRKTRQIEERKKGPKYDRYGREILTGPYGGRYIMVGGRKRYLRRID